MERLQVLIGFYFVPFFIWHYHNNKDEAAVLLFYLATSISPQFEPH